MAEATGIQALRPRGRRCSATRTTSTSRARRSAPSRRSPPLGVRTTGPAGGVHYLQYSFAPAALHLQRVPAVADRAARLRQASPTTRAPRELFAEAEPEAREEIPLSDVGDWSRYSYRGPEANRDYHELLREFLAVDVHAPAGRALLRLRRPLPRLPGRPARADLHGPRADDRQAADADPLRRVEAVGGRGQGLPRRQARVLDSSPPSGAASAPSRWRPRGPGAVHRAARRPRSCAPGWARRTGPRPRSRSSPPAEATRIARDGARARSSTRARAASARRASPPPPRAAARPPACAPSCSPPTRRTACRTRSRPSSAPSPRQVGREPVRPGGAGAGGDGAPLGLGPGLARLAARGARRRPHLGRGADRPARHGRAVLAAPDQAPPRGGRVRLRDRRLRAHRRDAAAALVPRRRAPGGSSGSSPRSASSPRSRARCSTCRSPATACSTTSSGWRATSSR